MLLNKRLLDFNLMIIRRTDKSFLKYIMDLGITPLVSVTTNGESSISLLMYAHELLVSKFSEEVDLLKIRPLNIAEIKNLLYRCSSNIKLMRPSTFDIENVYFILENNTQMILTLTFIDRNILCEN